AFAEGGDAIGDHLLRFREDLQDRPAQRLHHAALRLLDTAQILIDLVRWHRRGQSRRRERARTGGSSFRSQRRRKCQVLRTRGPTGLDRATLSPPPFAVKRSRWPSSYPVPMARLYAATGDGIARLDEEGEAWAVELSLAGSGAQCLAIDPRDPDSVYAGLREGGVR